MTWQNISADPNAPAAIGARRAAIDRAVTRRNVDRIELIRDLSSGKRVLDIGCVDHFAGAADRPLFLHGIVAAAAKSCVGIDINVAGVEALRERGFDARVHDMTGGAGEFIGDFDVVIAGEVAEHVPNLGCLFEFARDCLRPDGVLVVTTPNPYAPHRVRAGWLGITWENVDHICYLFPSGVVELCERAGDLELESFATTFPGELWRVSFLRGLAATTKQWLRKGRAYRQDVRFRTPLASLLGAMVPRFVQGETSVFVIRRR